MSDKKTSMAETEGANLPAPVAKRGIDETTWRVLKTSIFPGAASESILMACDYCKARRLDILKRVVHIVPMYVKDAKSGNKEWRDTVWPGIAEIRTTAHRTGVYAGMSEPEFGPDIEYNGITAPEWCKLIVYRLVEGEERAYPHIEFFKEIVSETGDGKINKMWTDRPRGQLYKCTEAGALRKAFPEELGGQYTAEEMAGREIIEGAATRVPDSETAKAATVKTSEDVVERLKNIREREAAKPADVTEAIPEASDDK